MTSRAGVVARAGVGHDGGGAARRNDRRGAVRRGGAHPADAGRGSLRRARRRHGHRAGARGPARPSSRSSSGARGRCSTRRTPCSPCTAATSRSAATSSPRTPGDCPARCATTAPRAVGRRAARALDGRRAPRASSSRAAAGAAGASARWRSASTGTSTRRRGSRPCACWRGSSASSRRTSSCSRRCRWCGASTYATVQSLLDTGIPVWLSFRRCRHGVCGVFGQHWGGPEGDAFGRAARHFEEMGVGALLVNCIPPDHVAGMLPWLRDFCDLPLGVYPNLGYLSDAGWRFDRAIGGSEYAQLALRWREEGAAIVGGCCGVGPGHIAAAKEAVEGTRPAPRRPRGHGSIDGVPAAAPARAVPPWRDDAGPHALPAAVPGHRVRRGRVRPHAGQLPRLAPPVPRGRRRRSALPRRRLRHRPARRSSSR